MNRLLKAAAALLCAVGISASASTSSITATLTDKDGTAWANAAYTAVLQVPGQPNVRITIGGTPLSAGQCKASGTASSSGVVTGTFIDTSSVDQKNAVWVFTIQPNASVTPSTVSVAIIGATPNLTANFSGLPSPRFPAGLSAYGYADGEVTNPALGNSYYNVVTPCVRQFSNAGWTCGGGGGGGASNPVTANLIAEYPMNEGTGTVLNDISQNKANATFAAGVNAPAWLPWGVDFYNTGIISGAYKVRYVTYPFSDFKTAFVTFCNPVIAQQTVTTVGGIQPLAQAPVLIGNTISATNGGNSIFINGNPNTASLGTRMTIFKNQPATVQTEDAGMYDGCHTYGFAYDASADVLMVDGQPISTYLQIHGSTTTSALTSGFYTLGGNAYADASVIRGVVAYSAFYSTELTVPQMQQVSAYINAKVQNRGGFPQYPIMTSAITPKLLYPGDSLTATYGSSTGSAWTTTLTLNNSFTVENWGISGAKASDTCYDSFPRWVQSIVPGQTGVNVWAGTNSLSSIGVTEIAQQLSTCAKNIHAHNGLAILGTTISRTGLDTQKNNLDNYLRQNYKSMGFDYLADYAGFAPLGADGANANTACFQPDATHLTGPGAGTCGTVSGFALSGYGVIAKLNSNLMNYVYSQYSNGNPHVISTYPATLDTPDKFVQLTGTVGAVTLPDCSGLTGLPFTLQNATAGAGTFNVVSGQPANGLTTGALPASSSVTFTVVGAPYTTGGCSWQF